MELNIIFCMALGILLVVWVEDKTWKSSNNEVSTRRKNGDFTCGIKITWYGWRVIEYAEEIN